MFCGSVFDVLAVENVKMSNLRGVKAYSLVDRYQHLGGTCYLHLCVVFRRHTLFRLEEYVYRCHTDFALFVTYIQLVTASLNLLILWLLFIVCTQHYNKECVIYISICGKQLTTECWLALSTPDNGGTIFTITRGPRYRHTRWAPMLLI
jgi:hypothetical protein